MAVQNGKRRRVEDEVRRPKKKIRKIKKQKSYHSSSEDEDEQEHGPGANLIPVEKIDRKKSPRANGTSQNLPTPKHESKVDSRTPIASLTEVTNEDEDEDDDAVEEEGEPDELEVNTALNMNPGVGSESEDEESLLDDVDDDEPPLDDDDLDLEDEDAQEDLEDDSSADESETASTNPNRTIKKRNDPNAFATSISKILTTKLTTQKRSDPILSRSKTADEAVKAIADTKLDSKARASIKAEKRSLLEKGRVRDVLGLETTGVDTGAIIEEEKRLKKTAQRGVIKLFNAVRAAQVKAEEGERQQKEQNVVGMQKREERVNELSKEGFLDLLSRGGKSEPMQA